MKVRKATAIILSLLLCMSLVAGCGSSKEEVKVTPEAASSAAAEETKAPEATLEATAEPTAEPTEAPAEVKEVTPQSLMDASMEAAKKETSMSYKMGVSMDMAMAIFGQETVQKGDIGMNAEINDGKAHITGSYAMSNGEEDQKQTVEQYVIPENGKYTVYAYSEEDKQWTKYTTETPMLTSDMIPKLDVSGFELETVNENGHEQYKVSGKVSLGKMMESAGDALGTLLEGMTNIGSDALEGEANVSYYFNKETQALEGVVIDMAEAFQSIFEQMFKGLVESIGSAVGSSEDGAEAGSEEGTEGGQMDPEALASLVNVQVNALAISVTDIEYGNVGEIVLPDAAKDAVETNSEDVITIDDSEEIADIPEQAEEVPLSVETADSFDFKDEYRKFTFDGKEFEIGVTTAGEFFEKTGLEPDEESKNITVEAGDTAYIYITLNDDLDNVTLNVVNKTNAAADSKDCVLYGAGFSFSTERDCTIAGIKYGMTLDQVIGTLGNPTSGYESEFFKSYTYEDKNWNSMNFSFGYEKDGVTGMEISCSSMIF